MKYIFLSFLFFWISVKADALTLRPGDQITMTQTGTEASNWEIKSRLVGKANGEHFDLILGDVGPDGQNDLAYATQVTDTTLISSYLAAGQTVTLSEPVTTVVLSNTAKSLRAKLKTDAKAAAIYAEKLEAQYYGSKSLLGDCYRNKRKLDEKSPPASEIRR